MPMVDDNHTVTFEVSRWDLEVVCHELSASARAFPLAWSVLKAARAQARDARGNPVSITLTHDSAARLTDWIDDHASLLTAQRFAKEAFSRFVTAIINGERATIAKRRTGKVISVPLAELPAEGEVVFKDVDVQGRQLTRMECGLMRRILTHYSLNVDGPVWVIRPKDVLQCLRFTERPDLDDGPADEPPDAA